MASNYIPAFGFNFLTPFYDFFADLLGYGAPFKHQVINFFSLKPDEKLLDLGCGTGTLLILAKKRFPVVEMVGVDIDRKVLEIAQSKAKKAEVEIKFIEAGAQKLPFKDSSFDVVVSTLIFHHLPTSVKKATLREIDRILKKNGRFLLDYTSLIFLPGSLEFQSIKLFRII